MAVFKPHTFVKQTITVKKGLRMGVKYFFDNHHDMYLKKGSFRCR